MNRENMFITRVRKVSGARVELEFQQVITKETPEGDNSAMGEDLSLMANKSAWTQNARRAWLSGMPEDLIEMFPQVTNEINAVKDTEKVADLSTLPTIKVPADELFGQPINIKVIENHTPAYENQDPKRRGPKNPQTGEPAPIMYHEGRPIFTHTKVVRGSFKHELLEADAQPVSTNASSNPLAQAQQA